MSKPLLIAILGPTASGKTRLAIDLARELRTEVLSSDSRQFYREMKIGTARPDSTELQGIPHHFLGFLELAEVYSAGKYEEDALKKLNVIFNTSATAILTGGSGLYVEAVCEGFDALPSDEEVRNELSALFESEGINKLQEVLYESDPDYYRVVDLQNPHRLIRALEVFRLTGKPYSSQRSGKPKERPFRILKIALDINREQLYAGIDQRVDLMLKRGLLEEVRALYPQRGQNSLNTLGYKELFTYIAGESDLNTAVELIKRNTRRYAKRQLTWLRRTADVNWIQAIPAERALEDALGIIARSISDDRTSTMPVPLG